MTAVRHIAAFLMLPFVVTVVVPITIARRSAASLHWPPSLLAAALGAILFLAGIVLFCASLYEFIHRGKGTLAPWDPPSQLVVHGPYRYVRNPMITGVVLLLTAEAALLWSRPIAEWAVLFAIINAVYIPLLEEPQLGQRFGESYREYCRHVPRLIPRLSPWNGAME
ncbi:MAG TPA: methyltransferase [Thermoanaerobaculia bacterium]